MENFANDYTTTLAGGITAGATTLAVTSATGSPAVPFRIKIGGEIIVVGAKAGTTFSSLTRGAEGTAAAAHADGDPVEHVLTAEQLASFTQSPRGTAFPATPAAGDRFYRTDRKVEYEYDGTRWLSVQQFTVSMIPRVIPPVSATSTMAVLPLHTDRDVFVEAIDIITHVTGANDASNRWDYTFNSTTTGASVFQTIGSASSNGNANSWTGGRITVNAVVASSLSTQRWLHAVATKVGAPGALDWFMATVTFRMIG